MQELQDHSRHWPIFERLFGRDFSIELWTSPPIKIGDHYYEFSLTKFMVLEVVAALIIIAIYVPLAKRIRNGDLPTGWAWNLFESIFVFIRDEIARPYLDDPHAGHAHDAHGHAEHGHAEHAPTAHGQGHAEHPEPAEAHTGDRFVPFLATQFLFLLTLNLLGLIPFLGSPTASIWVTGAMALCSFIMFHAPGIYRRGVVGYFVSLWPHIDVPYVGWVFSTGIFFIEFLGTFIKGAVLAVRLFANMFAGHMVLGSILGFIVMVGAIEPAMYLLWGGVSIASVAGVVALSLLELLVAFLQAYVFTFLTALFMGMSLYPEH
jgi:F-type H+-transporting ATPase subunit a